MFFLSCDLLVPIATTAQTDKLLSINQIPSIKSAREGMLGQDLTYQENMPL